MTPALCRCGIIWLPGHLDSFPAEGRMHRRDGCERIDNSVTPADF